MTGVEAVAQYVVERMLAACEALCRVVVLVVNVQIVVVHGINNFFAQQKVVNEWFCGLAGELHHHSRRGVGIHVGVLAGNVVRLDVDDFLKYVAGLGLARYAALVTVCDILLCNILATTLHELEFNHILERPV